MFDYACNDCTGNVLEALATQGMSISNSVPVRSAVAFLKKNQTASGYWTGRWAVNAIFGTFHAVSGLRAAGEPVESPSIQKGLNWLESVQNPDGGWGESTLSYRDPEWAGRGQSTPSQTAWAIIALLHGKRGKSESVRQGVEYLVKEFERNGDWTDASVVGTGHPRVVYLQYPSYAKTFPLLALGRWLRDRS
jgi:squalene-hopene/tetraprenyl-beta-curcumene cyclase